MSLEYNLNNPPKTMLDLYGSEEAQKVIKRCYEVNHVFGEWVCDKIYRELWELPPLTLFEKSLITIISLIVLKKEEQLEIHLKGLINLGRNIHFISLIINFLRDNDFIDNSQFEMVNNLLNANLEQKTTSEPNMKVFGHQRLLSSREKIMIRLASYVAIGELKNIENSIKEILDKDLLTTVDNSSEQYICGIFLHQMTYCGCPCTMNAFAVLNNVHSIKQPTITARL